MLVYLSPARRFLTAAWLLAATIEWAFGACDRVRFLEDRSRGVAVLLDTCPGETAIAPGTLLRLAPGARLWLASEENSSQMVCQSQADRALTLAVGQSDPPWLSSGSENCRMQDRRFICRDAGNGKPILLCVLASVEPTPAAARPRQGTSLVLRDAFTTEGLQNRNRRQAVITELGRTAELCHRLYGIDQQYPLSWRVNPAGQVETVEMPAALTQTHPQFAACLEDVIRSHPHPESSQAITLSAPM